MEKGVGQASPEFGKRLAGALGGWWKNRERSVSMQSYRSSGGGGTDLYT
ncbi:MAG: hypothetical protein GXX09_08990 [Syntrophomonadaceae bacterium]|nr:hypothetical protein [Syntrophomonadaceae bacterium]